MNEGSTETLSVVVEREIPHPPKPVVDHRFNLRADWGVQGAKGGWQQFFAALEHVLARID